jgi:hypothetical protein
MPTLDLQVGASANDCNKYYAAGWQFYLALGQSCLYVGGYDASYYQFGCGLRFTNVTIPQGATITTAYLIVTAWDEWGGNGAAQWYSKIRGQAADNAAAFNTLADFNARDWAAATPLAWSGNTAWTDNQEYQSPEIKTLIQAIVNRAGWTSGNALALSWDDFDNQSAHSLNRRCVWEYDGSTTKAVKLHIEYTIATAKTSSDTGSGADAYVSLEKGEAKISSDAGSGVEGTPMPSASLSGSETGSSIDAIIARLLASFDTGYGIEVGSVEVGALLQNLFASELGQGLDSLVAKIEMPTKGGGMKLWT